MTDKKMKKIIKNMTPHPIAIVDGEGKVVRVIESSGLIRLTVTTVSQGEVDGIPLSKTVFGDPIGLSSENWIAQAQGNNEFGQGKTQQDAVEDCILRCGKDKSDIAVSCETFYIVSQLVKSALPNRSDLLVPAEMVRDEKGAILGCKSLGF